MTVQPMTGFVLKTRIVRGIVAAALTAGLIAAAPPARAGEWVADKSGCHVWDPNPQLDEWVTWSGSCANGHAQGSGTVQWLKGCMPIETDEGEWHDGRQVKKGTQSWSSGRYEGSFQTVSQMVRAY